MQLGGLLCLLFCLFVEELREGSSSLLFLLEVREGREGRKGRQRSSPNEPTTTHTKHTHTTTQPPPTRGMLFFEKIPKKKRKKSEIQGKKSTFSWHPPTVYSTITLRFFLSKIFENFFITFVLNKTIL